MNPDPQPESTSTLDELQEELLASRQILKAIFENTQSSIFLVAPDYRILFFNKYARDGSQLLYGRQLFIGDSLLNYRRDGDEEIFEAFRTNFESAIFTKGLVVSEREMHYPPISFWVRSEYTPVYDDVDTLIGVMLHVHNISDRKKFENQNEEKQLQLNRIAWSHSHETRQPLSNILGLINILDKESLTPDNKDVITLLEQTVIKLDTIILQNVLRANIHSHGL